MVHSLVQNEKFDTSISYDSKLLEQHVKSIEIESHKILESNSNFWRSCKRKAGSDVFYQSSWIGFNIECLNDKDITGVRN